MSRDDGFAIADLDVGFLDDAKVRALVRSTRDEAIAARAIVAYIAAHTSSWANAERVSVGDAAPLWLTDVDDLVTRLAAAELVEADGRIVEHAWDSWFAKAKARRDAARDRWARYNARRQAAIDGDVVTTSSPRGQDHLPRGSEPDQRGNHVSRAGAVPPDPSSPSSPPGSVEGARRADGDPQEAKKDDYDAPLVHECPGCGAAVREGEPDVLVVTPRGGLGHRPGTCPTKPTPPVDGLTWLEPRPPAATA